MTLKHIKLKKVILLGSGALKIGEAGEFDYSGSQAIKALKEEKIKVVLVNPNIATIQTSEHLADKIYFLPVNLYFVTEIIKKERPDGIMLAFGGQTALNCGLELAKTGVLEKYKVRVLGTSVKTIKDTEDRKLFNQKLEEIKVRYAKSFAVKTGRDALIAAKKLGYPVMLRAAFALGGKHSGIVKNEKELNEKASQALADVPQILIEECLVKWKEIEYEVVRDQYDNCLTVCNMENFDPMGIHTGESIVVAPSQTLTNHEYHKLREIAIKTVRHLGIVGECNIQYAVNTKSDDYRVIEVNARLSRSSALASKATGYPLAFIAAKLALGHSLIELPNSITRATQACFEPALDYIVVKMPRWDLKKFKNSYHAIGSEMKSVGEVMAVGRKFEEALQKAIRMLDIGMYGLVQNNIKFANGLSEEMKNPTEQRIFAVAEAIKKGIRINDIYKYTGIDKWFLYKLKNIVDAELKLYSEKLEKNLLLEAKQVGFSDKQIAKITNHKTSEIRDLRKKYKILPVVKQIDTLAAEYPAKTNYLYMTYNGSENDLGPEKKSIITLGSGVYRIGSSVEFDWCAVNATITAKKIGYKTIMINYNPETVSTDYDICDRLYFDEISFERVLDIYEFENPVGINLSVGGQIANNLAMELYKAKVKVIGTSPKNIDRAENRHKFSSLLDKLKINQPAWKELISIEHAKNFATKVGYPVLVRPSYVLSGAAMNIVPDQESLVNCLEQATMVSPEHPVVISKFITNAREIEIDGVAQKGKLKIYAISEHVENAGIHSGDATLVLPPQRTYLETVRRCKVITKKIIQALNITGPFNIQFLAVNNSVKVIECNLRASRSFPFVSKVTKYNFIELATKAMLGHDISGNYNTLDFDYVAVKVPQFSYSRIKGADPVLYVEMGSTGEVACFGEGIKEALQKAMYATGFKAPRKNILISVGGLENKIEMIEACRKLISMGYHIYSTHHTYDFLNENGIKAILVHKISHHKKPDVLDVIKGGKVDFVINIPNSLKKEIISDGYLMRRAAIDYNVPLITNVRLAKLFIDSIYKKKLPDLRIKSWDEYKK
ncbi:carbamoyl-phosphate synthase (glutamine-hydrolyzing) large subunit [Candidatus Parcubacteria bacterium]|nr:MAG: carbamoyl-phosphate synthase (glutamine-hydrolyzing) large subunit [Candidatus Parcubacteria bacterium]